LLWVKILRVGKRVNTSQAFRRASSQLRITRKNGSACHPLRHDKVSQNIAPLSGNWLTASSAAGVRLLKTSYQQSYQHFCGNHRLRTSAFVISHRLAAKNKAGRHARVCPKAENMPRCAAADIAVDRMRAARQLRRCETRLLILPRIQARNIPYRT
jgi:hypothetical protein